jgi:chemotaxis protein methyltransferase CheR
MTSSAQDRALAELGKRIADQFGIFVPPERLQELPRRLQAVRKAFNLPQEQDHVSWVLNAKWGPRESDVLIDCLTVPETYFFRDAALWNYLSDNFLPALRDRGTGLNAWSAGCCTGEEPYSLAMSIDRLPGGLQINPCTIVGTDLNSSSISKAMSGDYGPWSLRATPASFLDKYFKSNHRNRYQLSKKICSMVHWRQFNLMDLQRNQAPPLLPANGFDIIFCRNVLIYFESQQSAAIIEEMHKYLAPGGILILSACDIDLASRALFECVREPGLLVLAKRDTVATHLGTVPPRLRPIAPVPSSDKSLPVVGSAPPAAQKPQTPNSGRPPVPPVAGTTLQKINALSKQLPPSSADKPKPPQPPVEYITPESANQLVMRGQYEPAVRALLGMLNQSVKSGAGSKSGPEIGPDVDFYLILLHALSNLGRTDEALGWVDKALTTFPLHEVLYFWRAVLLQQIGQDAEAVRAFQQAIFVDPDFVMAHFSLFMLFNKLGRSSEAEICRRNTQQLLEKFSPDERLPCSEELTARQIDTIMKSLVGEDGRKSVR